MNIKRVAVLGAGAVGSYVIWGLSNNKDITLGVIASGERNERLKKRGIMINGTQYTPEVWTPEEAKNVDLLIVSLKYGSLRGALDDIQTIVGCRTDFADIQNKKECGGNRQWQNHYLRNWAANTKGKGII